jgi:hypothetical protein
MYKGGRKDRSGEGREDTGHHCYSQGHTLYNLKKNSYFCCRGSGRIYSYSPDTTLQAIPDPTLTTSTKLGETLVFA